MYLKGVILNVAATSKIDQSRPLVWKAAQQLLLKPKLELFVTVSFLLMTHDKPGTCQKCIIITNNKSKISSLKHVTRFSIATAKLAQLTI